MKNQFKRIFAVLITLSMMISLLPAQFALAENDTDMTRYVEYGTDEKLPTSGHKGHVFKLEEVTGEAYNYKLTVSVYNPTAASAYLTSITYDHDTVALVTSSGTEAPEFDIASSNVKKVMSIAKLTNEMFSNSWYSGEDLTDTLFDTWTLEHKQIESTNSYQANTVLGLTQLGLTPSDWTNDEYETQYVQNGTKATYKFPKDKEVTLYTMYFKLQSGKTGITDKTIMPSYNDLEEYHGSATTVVGSDNLADIQDEKTYLIGFQEPQSEPQSVEFTKIQDKNNTGLTNAAIKIYGDEGHANEVTEASGFTDSNGYYKSAAVLAAGKYYYTVSLSGYQIYEDSFTVGTATETVKTITLVSNSDAVHDTTITVKDADSGNALSGVTVTVDGKEVTNKTNESGQVTVSLAAAEHGIRAELSGYQTADVNFTVQGSGNNNAEIPLIPERAQVTLPAVNDGNGTAVSGADVIVTKTSDNPTDQWGKTKTYTAGDTVDLPKNTEYMLTISAGGYSAQTIYLVVGSNGETSYYSDLNHTQIVSPDDITIKKLDDPYYQVNVTKGADGKTFTAEVTLNNISATKGTFGLKYDKDVFDFNSGTGFVLKSTDEIELFNPDASAPQQGNVIVESGTAETIGYHVFSWHTLNEADGEPIDATAGKQIAVYTFTLKNGKTENDIKSDAFTVMPYDKTSAGVAYLAASADDVSIAREFLDGLWRYTNEENKDGSLGVGRLSESKATLNGFYQVFVNSTDGREDADCMFDVITNVKYTNFEAAEANLNFIVTDEQNVPLDNASVKLCDSSGNAVTTLITDSTGIAFYPVNGDAEYQYSVSRPGYWDEPATGLNSVKVKDKTTANEFVKLEQKIYHQPVLQDNSGNPVADASLSGDLFAYNNRDYHFNIQPVPGKQIAASPKLKLAAFVNGVQYAVTHDDSSNTYVLDKASVTGAPVNNTPDANGFKSDDIIIQIVDGGFEPSNETYIVTANAGTNGEVSYKQDTSAYPSDISSTVSHITVSGIAPADSIGKFTFTANSGYKVEKVIVNGVQIHDYDNKLSFDYSFKDITMDNDITVTFWDGITHSDDAVVTLVAGPNGEVNVSRPNGDTVRDTRKTYLYTGGAADTFDFTLSADSGYSVNSVMQSVNGVDSAVSGAPDYSVSVAPRDVITVYVTFDTYTLFVKAHVKSGKGTIDPVGVLIINMYDSPAFTMTAENSDWSAAAVDVDGKEISNPQANNGTFVYTVQSIVKNTDVGAIFTETSYKVTGHVDLSQDKNLANGNVQTPAIVTCIRPKDGMKIVTQTTRSRDDAIFEAELPKGVWNITVSKIGYVSYTITEYEVKDDGTTGDFGKKTDGTIQKIVPYIGNTNGSGKTVSLTDAGVVSNGLRAAASVLTKAKADVDDDGDVSATSDMMYIKLNYGQRAVTEKYDEFLKR